MSQDNAGFPLDTKSESHQQAVNANTSQEIAAKIDELMRQQGVSDEANPLAAEKIRRDIEYQRQMETFAQPDSAPPVVSETTPEIDRLESLQKELVAAQEEAKRWKKEFGRREGTVGQMKAELNDLKARVTQMQPAINVQQITGRAPEEPITAQDAVNLLMSQSSAFGNAMARLREELLAQAATRQEDGLPLDMEAELVEAHPWLTDLPRPQKLRAMHDILASSGVTVTPAQPVAGNPPASATLPPQARAPVKQVAFIEPSNKGSAQERAAINPDRAAYQDKIAAYKAALAKPGGSEEAARILASLGAGPIDETQIGYMHNRR